MSETTAQDFTSGVHLHGATAYAVRWPVLGGMPAASAIVGLFEVDDDLWWSDGDATILPVTSQAPEGGGAVGPAGGVLDGNYPNPTFGEAGEAGIRSYANAEARTLRLDELLDAANPVSGVAAVAASDFPILSQTQTIATQAATDAIDDLVDGAPAALDTLRELAERLAAEGTDVDALQAQYTALAARVLVLEQTRSRVVSAAVGEISGTGYVDVTHNLGTRDVIAVVRLAGTPYDFKLGRVEAVTTNAVRVFSAGPVAANLLRVTVAAAVPVA